MLWSYFGGWGGRTGGISGGDGGGGRGEQGNKVGMKRAGVLNEREGL